jgi:hypothetical protein
LGQSQPLLIVLVRPSSSRHPNDELSDLADKGWQILKPHLDEKYGNVEWVPCELRYLGETLLKRKQILLGEHAYDAAAVRELIIEHAREAEVSEIIIPFLGFHNEPWIRVS